MKRRVTYTPEEVWAEVARIDEERGREYSLGQSLFFQVGFFASPFFFWDDTVAAVLDDFRTSAALGVPLALTLDDLPAFRSADFVVIQEELSAVRAYIAKQKRK